MLLQRTSYVRCRDRPFSARFSSDPRTVTPGVCPFTGAPHLQRPRWINENNNSFLNSNILLPFTAKGSRCRLVTGGSNWPPRLPANVTTMTRRKKHTNLAYYIERLRTLFEPLKGDKRDARRKHKGQVKSEVNVGPSLDAEGHKAKKRRSRDSENARTRV